MNRLRYQYLARAMAAVALMAGGAAQGQNTTAAVPPVIDVHMHAMEDIPGAVPMCPNQARFLASDPADGPEGRNGWSAEECSPKLYPAAKGEYRARVLAEMERLNVTGVVFGDPEAVKKWQAAAPARVIPGTSFGQVAGATRRRTCRCWKLPLPATGSR